MNPLFNKEDECTSKHSGYNQTPLKFKYQINSEFITFELFQNKFCNTLYIRSLGERGIVVFAYIPELKLLDVCDTNKAAIIKLMSHSKLITDIINNSIKGKNLQLPTFSKIIDFTNLSKDNGETEIWVTQEIIPIPLSQNFFVENTDEFNFMMHVFNEIIYVAHEYIEAYSKVDTDCTVAQWTQFFSDGKFSECVHLCLKHKFLPPFIKQVEHISIGNSNPEIRDILRDKKLIMHLEDGMIYLYGDNIPKYYENTYIDVLIMLDIFDSSLKEFDLCFLLQLKPIDSHIETIIDLGDIKERASILLHNVDTSLKAKISKKAFQYMPLTCEKFFYANKHNLGYNLEKYVETGKRIRINYDEKDLFWDDTGFKFDGHRIIDKIWSCKTDHFAQDKEWLFFNITLELRHAATVVHETVSYSYIYLKDFGLHIGKHLLKGAAHGIIFGHNPLMIPVAILRKLLLKR